MVSELRKHDPSQSIKPYAISVPPGLLMIMLLIKHNLAKTLPKGILTKAGNFSLIGKSGQAYIAGPGIYSVTYLDISNNGDETELIHSKSTTSRCRSG